MKVLATGTFDILHPGHGLYLKKAKQLGGKDSKLIVVVARDSTVHMKKRVPIVNEDQRLEMVKLLKIVDEAYLGHKTDMFKIVEETKPDIIAIGFDQKFNLEHIKNQLKKRNLDSKVLRVENYYKSNLDSTCKIIQKIKKTSFKESTFKDC